MGDFAHERVHRRSPFLRRPTSRATPCGAVGPLLFDGPPRRRRGEGWCHLCFVPARSDARRRRDANDRVLPPIGAASAAARLPWLAAARLPWSAAARLPCTCTCTCG